MTAPIVRSPPLARRLWIYQAERFPLFKHGLLIAAFGVSAVCVSALLRGATPTAPAMATAVVVLLGLFLQLRIADEHKDAEDDRRWRPERAVPRGLVSLAELRGVALTAAAAQGVAAFLLHPPLLVLLALVWGYMALMTAEFFAPAWLKARPILYLVSHMAVMPLIDLFATACDWLPAGGVKSEALGVGLAAFLALSFANGAALEIARKSWAPQDEREGVETYSKLWGVRTAATACAAAFAAAWGCAAVVQAETQSPLVLRILLALAAIAALGATMRYARAPSSNRAKDLENFAGVWVLASYVALGLAPVLMRAA